MRIIDAEELRRTLEWIDLGDAIAELLRSGATVTPERLVLDASDVEHGSPEATLLVMPSWLPGDLIVVKAVTYVPGNAAATPPRATINAGMLAFDGSSGTLLAVLDGDELTARRTAAASALAARSLARADATRLVIVGTGQLAPNLARAHAAGRSLDDIAVWGRRPDAAAAVVEDLRGEGLPARVAPDLPAAVERADIVSCCTAATEPVLEGAWLAPGVHVDLVGSFKADMREADDAVLGHRSVFVDTRAGARLAGDLAQPLAAGILSEQDIVADLADLVCGRHPGRVEPRERTVFKSAGFALEDVAAARLAIARAG